MMGATMRPTTYLEVMKRMKRMENPYHSSSALSAMSALRYDDNYCDYKTDYDFIIQVAEVRCPNCDAVEFQILKWLPAMIPIGNPARNTVLFHQGGACRMRCSKCGSKLLFVRYNNSGLIFEVPPVDNLHELAVAMVHGGMPAVFEKDLQNFKKEWMCWDSVEFAVLPEKFRIFNLTDPLDYIEACMAWADKFMKYESVMGNGVEGIARTWLGLDDILSWRNAQRGVVMVLSAGMGQQSRFYDPEAFDLEIRTMPDYSTVLKVVHGGPTMDGIRLVQTGNYIGDSRYINSVLHEQRDPYWKFSPSQHWWEQISGEKFSNDDTEIENYTTGENSNNEDISIERY